MQTEDVKRSIVREAYRLLKHGGRYGIHEMCLIHETLNAVAGGVVTRQSMLSKWKPERGCYKISFLCVGHETKHGFRPVVRLAIGDEG